MSLAADLAALPPTALVPVGWVLERLADDVNSAYVIGDEPRDLTLAEMAELARCSESAMRGHCRAGLVPGARKLPGGGWRCPSDRFRAEYLAGATPAPPEEAQEPTPAPAAPLPDRPARRLGDWRRGGSPRTRRSADV